MYVIDVYTFLCISMYVCMRLCVNVMQVCMCVCM